MHPTQNNETGTPMEGPEQQEVHSQTDSTNALHQVSQTDKVASQDSNVQTKHIDIQHSAMQTAPKDETQSGQQTEVLKITNTETQTVHMVRIVEPSANVGSQAGSWCPVDGVSQTNQSWSLMVEGDSQTELVQQEVLCQTEPTITGDQCIQVQPGQSAVVCQTVRDEQNVTCQTEVNEVEAIIQTDMSIANLVEGQVQATVDVAYQACQASVDTSVVEAQTESSMALLTEQGAQATAEAAEQQSQTDVTEIQETYVQTELETSQQCSQTEVYSEERDSQTEVYVVENECQTELEVALPVTNHVPVPPENPSLLPIVNNTPQVMFQETVDGSQMEDHLQIADISMGVASSQQSESSGAGASQVLQIVPEFSEEGSQTDPVTIIIGDASFLVKKLKSSSLSPTKVSSMGNEIEIELRADDEEATPYDMPDKENTVVPLPTPTRTRGNPSPYRARGVRTRGGAIQRGNYRASPQYGQRQQVTYSNQSQAGGQYYASSAGVLGKYSCPVCSDTFHESPALYVHLQTNHAEAFNLIKKPKGREGKTIQQKPYREPEPPILTPVEPIGVEQPQPCQQIEVYESTSQIVVQAEEPQDIGLFEDPSSWQSPNKSRKRTLARRQIADEETVETTVTESAIVEVPIEVQPTEEIVEEETTVKRKADSLSEPEPEPIKRAKKAPEPEPEAEPEPEGEPEPELPELQQEAEVVEETPRRRSRAGLRTIKQEKAAEVTSPEPTEAVKTPRGRGRPRKSDK